VALELPSVLVLGRQQAGTALQKAAQVQQRNANAKDYA